MRYAFAAVLLVTGCNNDQQLHRILSPPSVAITQPGPMEVLRKGEGPHVFLGVVEDTYDAPEAMQLTWILDKEHTWPAAVLPDGNVALQLDVEPLTLGEHLMELHAVDSDGDEAIAGLTWILDGAISAPQVTITAPETGSIFLPGEEITFRGEARDNNTALDDLEFEWSSSLDGLMKGDISADGQSVLFWDSLSVGTHRITLQATDRDGEVGIDAIQVIVGDVIAPAEPGDLVFSELMINPEVVPDDVGEWVELYNTASHPIDLAGYSFHDLDYDLHVLEGPLIVGPGDYIVLCANMNPARNGGVPCDGPFKREAYGALALGNKSDEVILSRPDGVVVDEVYYDKQWFRPGVAIGLDPSYLSSANNDTPDHWCDQTTVTTSGGEPGTPGRPNDPCF